MIRQIDKPLQAILDGWLIKRGLPLFPEGFLPEHGYMAFLGEKPVMAGFLYKDPSAQIAMLEWIVANPDSTADQRGLAFEELLERLEAVGKEIGVRYIFTTSDNPRLAERFKSRSFNEDRQATHFIKEI